MEDKSKPIATKTKAVVEEAARRVRERLPEIMQGLAVQVSGTPTKERLVSGSPPLIPGSGRLAPVIRPDVSTKYGETNEEYLAGREKQRERMQATGRSR